MPVTSSKLVHHYRALHGCRAKCGLEIFRHPGFVLVIASERNDNPGTSVTNWAEHLATEVCRVYDIKAESLVWIERYPGHGRDPEHWALCRFEWVNGQPGRFARPRWVHLNDGQLRAFRSGEWPDLPGRMSALALQEETEEGP